LVQPEVGEENDRRREAAHGKRRRPAGLVLHDALAAEAEGDAALLGDQGQVAIHGEGVVGAARHAGDQQRGAQPFAEELDLDVDLVQGQLRQRIVQQLDLFEERGAPAILDLLIGAEIEMRLLALGQAWRVGSLGRRHYCLADREVRRCMHLPEWNCLTIWSAYIVREVGAVNSG
jgi:hypothetical protein